MIPIVVTSKTASKVSRVARPVFCTYCGAEYVYWDRLESAATSYGVYGLGHTDMRGELAKDQSRQARSNYRPVPCPKCLLYPTYMTRRVSSRLSRRLGTVSVWAFLAAFLTGIVALVLWCAVGQEAGILAGGVAAFFALVTCGSIVVMGVSSMRYEPNADEHEDDRQQVADANAMTRAEFEAGELRDAEKSLADRLAIARDDPREPLDPVQEPLWYGFTGNEPLTDRAVTLPTGEMYLYDLPDDSLEFDEFDLKRKVDGVRIVFRVVLRFYHPTKLGRGDWKQAQKELAEWDQERADEEQAPWF